MNQAASEWVFGGSDGADGSRADSAAAINTSWDAFAGTYTVGRIVIISYIRHLLEGEGSTTVGFADGDPRERNRDAGAFSHRTVAATTR